MWLTLAFTSAFLLGLYDTSKKQALKNNAILPVLTLNTLINALLLLPLIILTAVDALSPSSPLHTPSYAWPEQGYILVKAILVLASWLFGYYGIKRLPLTIVGPINATRPVLVLIGAITIFGEQPTPLQWLGIITAILSIYLLSRSSKKEGINFTHSRAIIYILLANILGALSGLYDKYLMAPTPNGGLGLDQTAVQAYNNIYQFFLIIPFCLYYLSAVRHAKSYGHAVTPFRWHWSIPLISIFLTAADLVYFHALTQPDAMISIVSQVRRSSVIVTFVIGALFLHEKNLRSKTVDLTLLIISMLFLYFGSK